MNGLSWTQVEEGGIPHIALVGELDELSDLNALFAALPEKGVLDLAGIRRINSCGVREWIHFASKLRESGKKFELERCSTAVVSQLNMIMNFTGNMPVQSVMAPYYCESCNFDRPELIPLESGKMPEIPDALTCPKCQGPLEFDDIADKYLAFHLNLPI